MAAGRAAKQTNLGPTNYLSRGQDLQTTEGRKPVEMKPGDWSVEGTTGRSAHTCQHLEPARRCSRRWKLPRQLVSKGPALEGLLSFSTDDRKQLVPSVLRRRPERYMQAGIRLVPPYL
ncbi:hypothetical protein NDU88_000439 [Pleurodeles waltl]|uniref:Uncharacterized protein n=1 Tax=Pleurodeles waltl TaxID=8319 RepID=A0AAV7V5R5_PLEWA|nr:hypothetical protein NDU88_000439 [Pleurodeles waltl]